MIVFTPTTFPQKIHVATQDNTIMYEILYNITILSDFMITDWPVYEQSHRFILIFQITNGSLRHRIDMNIDIVIAANRFNHMNRFFPGNCIG